ncbi:glycosyltransferase [endosymbiont of Acanthamoeba sp. UWC8]|uniref:glycosyltransferase n=1 Tax=endosymbiont of Acanthamoeba sp. UWC8 TaxID=86106 RepID=UPI0011DC9AE3|nr:glycosyltransferase [endosymbiont of Acanthamoeba sp. UWC8]
MVRIFSDTQKSFSTTNNHTNEIYNLILKLYKNPFLAIYYLCNKIKNFAALLYKSQAIGSYKIDKLILNELKSIKFDIIHCHDLNTTYIGVRIKKNNPSIKFIFDSHEIYFALHTLNWFKKIKAKMLFKKVLKYTDGFITVNDSIAQYFQQLFNLKISPVVIKNAAQQDIQKVPYDNRLHKVLNLSFKTKILLYHGGYSKYRGLPQLVAAGELLPKGWVLVMIGWGKLENDLKDIAIKNGTISKKVFFLPKVPQSELLEWTKGASIGIIPYENIGLNHYFCSPNKIWEFCNADVPFLAPPYPEFKKIINKYNVGWFIDEEITSISIINMVKKLDDHPETIRKYKESCNKFVKEDHWGVYAEKLLRLYEKII